MDFLDKLVLPQSAHHMVLLKYLLVLTFILFIPYISILFGTLTFSLFFKKKFVSTNENKYYKFSKDLIDTITFNKGIAFALGVVPLLSSVFCYAQLLHLSDLKIPVYLLISLFFLILSLLLIYTYKYTFHLKDIFEFASKNKSVEESLNEQVNSYKRKTSSLNQRTGIFGWISLFISTYLFVAALQLALDSEKWSDLNNFLGLLFSLNALIYYLQFILFSFGLTSAVLLYIYFRNNNEIVERDEHYLEFIKSFSLKIGLISTILLPSVIVLGILFKPKVSFSFDVFGAVIIALFILLLISVFYYFMLKESSTRYGNSVIYLFVIALAFLIIKDQFAFDTATKKQFILLTANYEEYQQKLQEKFGLVEEIINAQEIYNGKCIACHQFDRRVVGPPYKEVLPKYEGKMEELTKFILNPVKINPDYPPMPNQGLKPKEAQAVAEYIMVTYLK